MLQTLNDVLEKLSGYIQNLIHRAHLLRKFIGILIEPGFGPDSELSSLLNKQLWSKAFELEEL